MGTSKCNVCGDDATNKCGGCGNVVYCGKDHQRQDWKHHKSDCKAFKIIETSDYGRCMVSTREIKQGEVIFRDRPIIVGPKQLTRALCLGCYVPVDGSYKCRYCGYPLCGVACESSADHRYECRLCQKHDIKMYVTRLTSQENPHYEPILPLRCLVLRDENPAKWNTILRFESHGGKGLDSERDKINQLNVVDVIHRDFGYDDVDDDLIHELCAIFDINSFEIRIPGGVDIRGLYTVASMMAHNCVPNSQHIFDEEKQIIVRAAVPIRKGELITISYTHILAGTLGRRRFLKRSKYFDCFCKRCTDPTELSTFLSSVKCLNCAEGYAIPMDPLHETSAWKCNSCNALTALEDVKKLHTKASKSLRQFPKGQESTVENYEKFLNKFQSKLHPNHQILINVKDDLGTMLGRHTAFSLEGLSESNLARKIECCSEVLRVLDVICPGYTRYRGVTLYELHAALILSGSRKFASDLISTAEFEVVIKRAAECLKECMEILKFEMAGTTEGKIYQAAVNNWEQIKEWFRCFESLESSAR